MLATITGFGFTIWLLLLTSVLTLALILERLVGLRKGRVLPVKNLQQMIFAIESSALNQSMLKSIADDSPAGELMVEVVGLYSKYHGTLDIFELRALINDQLQSKADLIRQKLSRLLVTLGTLATIAPLLGLLGTVFGMIEIFSAAPTGSDPTILAHGISIALWNTAFGLLIAIPAMIFHRAFKSRVDTYMLNFEQLCNQVLNALHERDFNG